MGDENLGSKATEGDGMKKPSELEEMLYASLRTMPCKCNYAWKPGPYDPSSHDTLKGRYKTYECPRCLALTEYEKRYDQK